MNLKEIETNIIMSLEKIAPEISNQKINLDQNLRNQIDLDSIDYLRFLTDVSKKFNVQISEKDYQKIQTLNNLSNYLLELKST